MMIFPRYFVIFSSHKHPQHHFYVFVDDNNIVKKNIKVSLTLGLELSVLFVVSILYKYSVLIQLCKSSLRSGSNTEINDLADEMEMLLAVYTWKHGQTYVAVNQQCLLLLFFSSINTTDRPTIEYWVFLFEDCGSRREDRFLVLQVEQRGFGVLSMLSVISY